MSNEPRDFLAGLERRCQALCGQSMFKKRQQQSEDKKPVEEKPSEPATEKKEG